jgi:lycopene cyclase domain-containing protein
LSLYFLLNIIIISIPLLLTFAPKVYYHRRIKSLLFSILVTSTLFIIWDALATARGDWAFNHKYVGGCQIFGLPLEEILFFLTVPYSCIFLYETFKTYFKEKKVFYSIHLYNILALICFAIAIIFVNKAYTATVFILTGTLFASARFCFKSIFTSSLYWLYIIVCTLLFGIFNHVLTSLPVVSYSSQAITGLRVGTIPVEDFFYNFSLLSFYLIIYLFAEEKWGRRK